MSNDKNPNVVPGPWVKPEAYANTSLLADELQRQAEAIFALEDSVADSMPPNKPWIRTKKNSSRVSRLGMDIFDIMLIALLFIAIGLVSVGYQFNFWEWACQDNQCQWISDILNYGAEK